MKNNTRLTLKSYIVEGMKRPWLGVGFSLSIIIAASVDMLKPIYYKNFFNFLDTLSNSSQDTRNQLLSILGVIAIISLIEWFFWRFAMICSARFQALGMESLSNTCFAYLHKHSINFFNNNFVGSLVKRVNYYTRAFEEICDRIFWNLLPLFVRILVILYVLSQRDFRLGLVLLLWTVLFLSTNWLLTRYKLKYDIARSDAETASTGVLADTITNQNNLKLLCGYDRERENFAQSVAKVRKLRMFTWNLDTIFDGLQGLLMIGLEVGIIYLAIGLWQNGLITIGDFVLIQAYLLTLFMGVWDFGKHVRAIYERLADADDMTKILNTPHEIADAVGAEPLVVRAGKIELVDVQFNYNATRTVLNNFNLAIAPGEKVALVGPSGAGKSTIVKILLRQHDLTDGKILIDNQNINKITLESLWHNISLVPQEPILFHRTLKENIRYGQPEATDAEVEEAAKLAHCHEFISGFPEGYETFVGERGVKLSGGERQRVAIARAILRNAPILILDEATSSLDSESEHYIQQALSNLMHGKTVIVIAHRLSTIMEMDRIVVIDGGSIVEEGKHAKLLTKQGGLYRRLWEIQAGGFMAE